jgi:hypothetical protein
MPYPSTSGVSNYRFPTDMKLILADQEHFRRDVVVCRFSATMSATQNAGHTDSRAKDALEVGVMFQTSEVTAHRAFGSIWRLGCADGWKDGKPVWRL